ncbi:MAG: DNA translocase FtsK 4TM domain-containing protein, partial [Planctomycetota bacterium]
MSENRSIYRPVLAVGFLALAVFLAAALFSYRAEDPANGISLLSWIFPADVIEYPPRTQVNNSCGSWGATLANLLFTQLGIGAYYVLSSLVLLAMALLTRSRIDLPLLRWTGWLVSVVGITALSSMMIPNWSPGPMMGSGGTIGALGASLLQHHFAFMGSLILAVGITLGGLLLCSDYLVMKAVRLLFDGILWLAYSGQQLASATWSLGRGNEALAGGPANFPVTRGASPAADGAIR